MLALRQRALQLVRKKIGFSKRTHRERMFGREFNIPVVNGRRTYLSEPWMADMIRRLFALKAGGFIDVGVNLGQTMVKVAAVGPDRAYLGFEPNPSCADYAEQLAAANDLPYRVVPAGLGSKTQLLQLQFYGNEDTDPSASLVEGFRGDALRSRSVIVISADELPAELMEQQLAIIKIDVEGGESDVIEGIASTLKRARPFLLVEILPAYSTKNKSRLERQRKIEAVLKSANYAMFQIRKDQDENLSGVVRISEIGIETDLAMADYLMVPVEDIGKLGALVL